MPVSLQITATGIDKVQALLNPAKFKRGMKAGLEAALLQTEAEAKDSATRIIYSAPERDYHRTGLYRASLGRGHSDNVRELHGDSAKFGSKLFYAPILEDGSKPHIIRAKSAKVLANRRAGKVFGKVVHHPGTRPRKVLEHAVKSGGVKIVNAYAKALAKSWGVG
jgi:hypothetical protein